MPGVPGVPAVPGVGMEEPGVLFVFTPLLVAAVEESFFIISESISRKSDSDVETEVSPVLFLLAVILKV